MEVEANEHASSSVGNFLRVKVKMDVNKLPMSGVTVEDDDRGGRCGAGSSMSSNRHGGMLDHVLQPAVVPWQWRTQQSHGLMGSTSDMGVRDMEVM
jgi:hypothetical protein